MQPKRDMKGSRRERWMRAAAFCCLLTMLVAWLLQVSPATNPSGLRLAPSVSTASAQTDEPPAISNATAKMSAPALPGFRIAETESVIVDRNVTYGGEPTLALSAAAAPDQSEGIAYTFEIIAQTGVSLPGVGTVDSLGKGPSMNNQGNVVFTAVDDAVQHAVFTEIDGTLDTQTVQSTIFSFDENVQINDARNNTQRRIVWHEQSNDGLLNKINRLGTFGNDFQIVARNRFLPLINSPFDLTRPWATMNNNGRVVFSAVTVFGQATFLCTQKVIEGSGFETIDDYYCADQGLSNFPDLYPMVSDNDRVVVRGGHDETAPLVVFTKPTLKQSEAIFLGQPIGFDTIGSKPGISDDSRFVAFMGAGPSIGAGIFGLDLDANVPTLFQIAGPPLSQSFSSVGRTSRVGVNRRHSNGSNEYYVAFLAARATGGLPQSDPFGIYVSRFELNDPGQPAPDPVNIVTDLLIEVGETIPGFSSLGSIQDISVYDPINSTGSVVFWIITDSGKQAIFRACADNDGDALCDLWEINGVDFNENDENDLEGADPEVKDIFVRIDWLENETHSHKPSDEARNLVKSAFAKEGINLHLIVEDEEEGIYEDPDLEELLSAEKVGNNGWNFDWKELNELRKTYLHENDAYPKMSTIYHYAVFGHYLPEVENPCPEPHSFRIGGIRQPGTSDLIVALEKVKDEGEKITPILEASVFMHELGHTLGLKHGGTDRLNFKPNHLSIMNYSFTGTGLIYNGQPGLLDYSQFGPDTIPNLKEDGGLNEAGGLHGGEAIESYKTIRFCGQSINKDGELVHEPNKEIDWDCDGINDEINVKANINKDGNPIDNCSDKHDDLSTVNEWKILEFRSGNIGKSLAELPEFPQYSVVDEPDLPIEEILEVVKIVRGYCTGDFNGDKDVDGKDLAEYTSNSAGINLDVFAANYGRSNCP